MAEGLLPEYSRQDLYFDELLSGRLGGEKTLLYCVILGKDLNARMSLWNPLFLGRKPD